MRQRFVLAFALLIAAAWSVCAPARAQVSTITPTPAQRADQAIDDMKAYRLVSGNAAVTARFEAIFRKVEQAAGVAGKFRVLVANAPAYPHAESHANGVIVITESFAAFTDREIAFVLAHELAHEIADHPYQQSLLSDQLRGAESASSFQVRVVFGMLPPEITDKLRNDETAADRHACALMQRAGLGFDAQAFFQHLSGQPAASPDGTASHPSYAQRVANLKELGCSK
jgi:Zn-dependent protease with chaperone function